MDRKDIAERVAGEAGIAKQDAEVAVGVVFDSIAEALARGEEPLRPGRAGLREQGKMLTAIHRPKDIAQAQEGFLQRMRGEFRTTIPDVAFGFQGGGIALDQALSNDRIWFAHKALEGAAVPRHWNAFGMEPLEPGRSHGITVEVNVAIDGVDKRVAALFAVDDKTGNTVLLHRGRIGGGRRGIGREAFMEWYQGKLVMFADPSRGGAREQAILVADLASSDFLVQLESFVDAVHRFKAHAVRTA
ncbi:MAG: HU family DNA-binding protein [Boseongicola sp.]|nr:HU family DNA-binding protein [Boseongicola sp.]